MKVYTTQPFQLIYSLFEHEYLGYTFESFVVQKNSRGDLTFSHQNISSKNASEFGKGMDDVDYELIELMDEMQQDVVVRKFAKKKMKPAEFFDKYYNDDGGSDLVKDEIERYMEKRRSEILSRITGKLLFEMGNDGEPAWRQIEVMDEKATILFHFVKNEDNTHYFPTIKHNGEKLEFQYKGAYLICNKPAWLVVDQKLYSFEKNPEGKKIKPFLNKKFIAIPEKVEETYFKKFVAPLVASFDVFARGFKIKTYREEPLPKLKISELVSTSGKNLDLFSNGNKDTEGESKLLLELKFQYGEHIFPLGKGEGVSVKVEKEEGQFVFKRLVRNLLKEKSLRDAMIERGLDILKGKITAPKTKTFSWISKNVDWLKENEIEILQDKHVSDKNYFVGKSTIEIDISEGIDWFDINAVVMFGDYEVPFKELRKHILNNQLEFKLPNNQTAVIPSHWFEDYSELFSFMENGEEDAMKMRKHHISLVSEMENSNLAKVQMDRKLAKLKDFTQIDDHPMPSDFSGELRPYQKEGFNWLQFLNQYNFGGCLADDMGLGKTVQTLAMLQSENESGRTAANLLIMPTSLIYNWQSEAEKFTPELKIFVYTGTNRIKDSKQFEDYDLVLTSYGITRLDVDILSEFLFNYIILDESQAIKNPESHIAKAVRKLKSRRKLVLTGTPVENSTMDLWSQMSFVNPGLLGNKKFFKDEFVTPIEKKRDEQKSQKLATLIKPFILRRHKSQVATELPDKIENVHYSGMTTMQEEKYEEVKNYFRDMILDEIEKNGVRSSQMILLQGLTQLRQIANHPKMTDQEYQGDSGKMEDVTHMLNSIISKGHKILVFSQFVKHLSLFKEYMERSHIKYAYLDGTTKDRQKQVKLFQENEEISVFLISLKAGGLGLNLTAADYVFLLDPWWNPAIEQQAVDRAHRIGQKQQVFTYKFITKNSVEEKILALQQKKLTLARDLISTEESFMKSLSKEDIEGILA
ncbi:DEAD/DEAH box helicase [Marivirga harenae]|uniref:DEAD/DEAH box helicase n=1 Tax=Marivirga harenae TaxID=2010992 RepID=UPI0026E04916|nr:DEAD/DEAH box helicase [Marivirga harenae]WKV13528.1 DEAD/DEAH box helicase [Marivirga harenae]|tara:strand:+ start:158165 stop:161095 length:2931 start_codon:yes stop_codon:yes gene_type:complete